MHSPRTLLQRIRALTGTPDPATDRGVIVDAMRRTERAALVRLNSAQAELYVIHQRMGVLARREWELTNLTEMLRRGLGHE